VILGCSEVSIVSANCGTYQFINPIKILAKSAALAVDASCVASVISQFFKLCWLGFLDQKW